MTYKQATADKAEMIRAAMRHRAKGQYAMADLCLRRYRHIAAEHPAPVIGEIV